MTKESGHDIILAITNMNKEREQAARLAKLCRALSVESRARMVGLLRDGPLCVGALSGRLGLSQGAASQHLRVLREAGLVRPRKIGYFTHYRLVKEALEGMAQGLGSYTKTIKRKGRSTCAVERKSARSRRT